jgi:poly [ADP-ribose] polymerase
VFDKVTVEAHCSVSEIIIKMFFRENILCEPTTAISLDEKAISSDEEENIPNITTSDIENLEDPLEKVKPGLRFEGDSLVPLQCVHIRAKLLDLCAKVVVMQVYNNPSSKPIEAKYVFPLDDMAAGKLAL